LKIKGKNQESIDNIINGLGGKKLKYLGLT